MDSRSKSITFQSITIPSLGRGGYSSGSSDGLRTPMRCLRLFVFAFLAPCLLIAVPLYQRRVTLAPRLYTLTASDMRAVEDGISSVWCEAQELSSEAPFTSYRSASPLPQHSRRVPVTLRHRLTLTDDVREFWGFYLLRGSRISVSACARWPGTSLLLVHGWDALNECVWVGQMDSLEEESSEEDEDEEDDDDVAELDPVRRQWREFLRQHPRPTAAASTNGTSSQSGEVAPHPTETPPVVVSAPAGPVPPEVLSAPAEGQTGGTAWEASAGSDRAAPAGPANTSHTETQLYQRGEEVGRTMEKRLVLMEVEEEDMTPFADSRGELAHEAATDWESPPKERYTSVTNVIERNVHLARWRRRKMVSDAAPSVAPSRGEQVRPSMADRIIPLTYNGHRGRVNQTHAQIETSHSEMISSFSSSEEKLLSCQGVIVNQPLRASAVCSEGVGSTADQLTVQVIGDDYYYLVFYSENELLPVDVFFDVTLEKTVYDVRAAEAVCANSTHCRVPLGFWSSDTVVLEYPVDGDAGEAVWSEQYTVRSSCEPRGWVVALFIVAALCSLFVCAFC